MQNPVTTLIQYTVGGCINNQMLPCSPDVERCCQKNYEVHFNLQGKVTDVILLYQFPPVPPCPPQCTPVCDDVKNDPYYMVLCDMPCNKTKWISQFSPPIEVPDCPGCHIGIDFRFRNTSNCNPNYHDYHMRGFYKSIDCFLCNLTDQELYAFSLGWLLKYGPITPPLPGRCDTTWRIATASCWDGRPDGSYLPCIIDGCCWSQYLVCNNNDNITYQRINGSSADPQQCNWPPSYCCFAEK